MITSQTIIPRAHTLLASVILLIHTTHAAPEAATVEPEFHIPKVSPQPENLAKVAAAKQAAVFSLGFVSPDAGSIMNKGFFLSRDGIALCPLLYLCRDALPRFDASDGTLLGRPKVLATFPDHGLALLKFKYQPKAWLGIASKRPAVGQWVALVSTLRDPPSPLGPVLAHRAAFLMNEYPRFSTHLSFAVGRSPSQNQIFAYGAPLIDSEGKAVGVYAGGSILAAQTLRSALPIDDLEGRIAAAIEKPGDFFLPIGAKHHCFDVVRLSPEWGFICQASGDGNLGLALDRAEKLMGRYPDCRWLRDMAWHMRQQHRDGMTPEEFAVVTRRTVPPQNASDAEKAEYQFRLATALYEISGAAEEAEKSYRRAAALAPELSHLAAANLAGMLMCSGQTKEAVAIYRKVVTLVPERIDYIEALQNAVEARGDLTTSDKLNEWIYQLEEYYRSR
jgi:tetratricopeptide (TPR) repeat protein